MQWRETTGDRRRLPVTLLSPDLTAADLDRLSRLPQPEDRGVVAAHPNTGTATLDRLLGDRHGLVRHAAAVSWCQHHDTHGCAEVPLDGFWTGPDVVPEALAAALSGGWEQARHTGVYGVTTWLIWHHDEPMAAEPTHLRRALLSGPYRR